ncbi:MAG: hypothetical protein KC535_00620, partial [Nanoarchaeota archaeon]|nr:hypothetical protein [Nanoarchaeota archaeon]
MTEENYQQPPEEGGNKITISQGSFLDRLVNSDEFNKSMKKKEKEVEKIGQVMTKVTKNASLAFKQKGGLKTILDGFKHRSLKEIAVGAKTIVKRKATFSEMIEASYDRALNSKEAIKRNIDNAAEGLRDISSQINTLLEEKSTLAISHEEKSIELQGYNSQIASYENDLGNLSTTDKKFHLKQAELQKSLNEVVQSKTELSLEIFSINASIKAKNEGYDLLCSIRTEAETRLPGFETLYAIATSRLETADIIVRNAVKSAKVSEDITNYYADLKQLEEVLEGESELAS